MSRPVEGYHTLTYSLLYVCLLTVILDASRRRRTLHTLPSRTTHTATSPFSIARIAAAVAYLGAVHPSVARVTIAKSFLTYAVSVAIIEAALPSAAQHLITRTE